MVDPIIGAAGINALANLGGGIMSASGAAAQNAAAAERNRNEMYMWNRNNDMNMWYFQKNWENQQYMSNTAYQRAMQDMRAAGLNPILAYQQGGANANAGGMSSAASGSLSDPMPQNPQGELGRGIGRAVSSGLEAATSVQGLRNAQSTQALTDATAAKTAVDTERSKAETLQTMEQTQLTKGQTAQLEHQKNLLLGQTSAAHAAAASSSAQAQATSEDARRKREWGDTVPGQWGNTIQQVLKRLGGALAPLPQQSPAAGPPNWRDPNWKSPNKWWNK